MLSQLELKSPIHQSPGMLLICLFISLVQTTFTQNKLHNLMKDSSTGAASGFRKSGVYVKYKPSLHFRLIIVSTQSDD